jgi:hypothetical protein
MMSMKFKNRYGNEYYFEEVSPNTFAIKGDLNYWRYGGKEGQEGINDSDLGFVDPSGGPFISVNEYRIMGRLVKRIHTSGEDILFDVAE